MFYMEYNKFTFPQQSLKLHTALEYEPI
jgi:hypothetical protein